MPIIVCKKILILRKKKLLLTVFLYFPYETESRFLKSILARIKQQQLPFEICCLLSMWAYIFFETDLQTYRQTYMYT